MIVTLATQIIFRGIAEIATGKRWKYLSIQYRWFPSYWWKSRKNTIHSVPGSDPCSNLCSDPWKVHLRTQGICHWYKPSHSILLRNPCKKDPLYYLHSYGNFLWTVCSVSGSIHLMVPIPPQVMDLKWMPSQWRYSEEFLPQVEKVTWQAV